MVSPYPTGTYTLQEMPSFAWRTHPTKQEKVELVQQIVLSLYNSLWTDSNIHLRRKAITTISNIVLQLPDEKEFWFKRFAEVTKNQQEMLPIRLTALKILRKLDSEKAVELIIKILQPKIMEEDRSFTLTAFRVLGDTHNPKALKFLQNQLEILTQKKQAWRTQRDKEISAELSKQTQECLGTSVALSNIEKKRWHYSQYETDLGYAIAQIDPKKVGIQLLQQELAEVRKGAWRAIGDAGNVQIIKALIQKKRSL
jgi:hypothetical protein